LHLLFGPWAACVNVSDASGESLNWKTSYQWDFPLIHLGINIFIAESAASRVQCVFRSLAVQPSTMAEKVMRLCLDNQGAILDSGEARSG
jgi:hypothetical protein